MELRPFDQCGDLSLAASISKNGDRLELSYVLAGDLSDVVIPSLSLPKRTDGLWRSTCFEAFIATGSTSYVELNFAPSGQWAAYTFEDYRDGMTELEVAPPKMFFGENRLIVDIEVAAPSGSPLNLTAVIERRDGVRSFWALAHPAGSRPDFHARDCFVAKLP